METKRSVTPEKRKEYLRRYYQKLKEDPVRWERFKKQQLKSYHKHKGGWKEREKRDRENARRRKGPAKGNYGPRSCVPVPEVSTSDGYDATGTPLFRAVVPKLRRQAALAISYGRQERLAEQAFN